MHHPTEIEDEIKGWGWTNLRLSQERMIVLLSLPSDHRLTMVPVEGYPVKQSNSNPKLRTSSLPFACNDISNPLPNVGRVIAHALNVPNRQDG